MKYNKPTVEAKVKTLVNYEATFADGKDAVEAFDHKQTLKGKVGDDTVIIPFHAVKILTETKGVESVDRKDPYCESEEEVKGRTLYDGYNGWISGTHTTNSTPLNDYQPKIGDKLSVTFNGVTEAFTLKSTVKYGTATIFSSEEYAGEDGNSYIRVNVTPNNNPPATLGLTDKSLTFEDGSYPIKVVLVEE